VVHLVHEPGGQGRHCCVTSDVERHHWLNAIVGVLDAAWNLTAEEQYHALRIIGVVLDELGIPERGAPCEIPAPVAMEVEGGFYSSQLHDAAGLGLGRPVRALQHGDQTFAADVWRTALVEMFTTAYPDLNGVERVWLTRTIGDLLGGIGVTTRAPVFLPEDVVRIAMNP
jgi:hypothetical protein